MNGRPNRLTMIPWAIKVQGSLSRTLFWMELSWGCLGQDDGEVGRWRGGRQREKRRVKERRPGDDVTRRRDPIRSDWDWGDKKQWS